MRWVMFIIILAAALYFYGVGYEEKQRFERRVKKFFRKMLRKD